ncbi:MAG TPA: fused MFS/spermidine synthase [Alcaligenes sp.]|nr:fused MFS/spermidine synthase [Alcaligenes sp.]HRL27041.1 fused MFS/spermidine synthase [Alcaligenes sp.]
MTRPSPSPRVFSLRHIGLGIALIALLAAALWLVPAKNTPVLLHSEPSRFGTLLVFEEQDERCMNFNSINDLGRQTCMSLAHPEQLVFDYTQMMMTALYVNPEPKHILIIGLGGASLQNALAKALPDTIIDSVEIDPAVGTVAQRYFGYRPGPRQRLFLEDGRSYVERAAREGTRYDMVMLDAFDVDYVPEHLMTLEFLQHVRAILAPGAVVVANTFTNSELYERESATYAAVFGDFFNLESGNRVIIASNKTLPGIAVLTNNARTWQSHLARLGIDSDQALARFSSIKKPANGANVLRD